MEPGVKSSEKGKHHTFGPPKLMLFYNKAYRSQSYKSQTQNFINGSDVRTSKDGCPSDDWDSAVEHRFGWRCCNEGGRIEQIYLSYGVGIIDSVSICSCFNVWIDDDRFTA